MTTPRGCQPSSTQQNVHVLGFVHVITQVKLQGDPKVSLPILKHDKEFAAALKTDGDLVWNHYFGNHR